MSGPVAVYRMFDADGVLLYVGQSPTPALRHADHARHRHWPFTVARIDVSWFPTKQAALAEEERAISTERPLHNVHHNRASSPRRRLPHSGGDALLRWMMGAGHTFDTFAAAAGITARNLRRILRNEVRPNFRTQMKVEDATCGAITSKAWAREPAQERRNPGGASLAAAR